jgi:sugar phosphate isomerase/epimerase
MAELPAPDFVAAAHHAGFHRVSIRLVRPPDGSGRYAGNALGAAAQDAMRAQIADLGMAIEEVEYARLTPDCAADAFEPLLEGAARIGARDVVAIAYGFDSEVSLTEAFGEFSQRAAAYELGVLLEFIAISSVATVEAAQRVVQLAQAPRARITVDILHLVRSGGSPASLAGIEPSLIGSGQICDAPLAAPVGIEAQRHEMGLARLLPGEGALPIRSFIEAMPVDVPIGVEVLRGFRPKDAGEAAAEAEALMRAALAYFPPG